MSRNKIIHVGCVGPFNLEIRREFRSQRYGGTTSTAGSRVVVITGGAFAGTHTGPIILNW